VVNNRSPDQGEEYKAFVPVLPLSHNNLNSGKRDLRHVLEIPIIVMLYAEKQACRSLF